ncbi:ArsR/SmtB family transcription factor [Haloarchaeobius sp. DFWS5]|uniref:ArsR/SmtB family transcription factor n=1 Tax=Haloarchaeobius sp. DFWS5 TaxID=3446114 RepID=UPI003EBE32EB
MSTHPADLLALLHDEYARSILLSTSAQPMSASELSETCDMSRSTVYRRVDDLSDHGLLRSYTRPDPEGHHHTVYEATVSRVEFEFDDGDLAATVEGDEDDQSTGEADAADRFTSLWRGVRGDDG